MMATAKTIAPDRPVLDWPAICFLAIVHVGALAALLPGAFSWPAIGVAVFLRSSARSVFVRNFSFDGLPLS